MASKLEITLLGNPVITLDDKPVTGFVSSKAQALVYYLAATGQSHGRETLAGLLWSDVPDSSAKKNLRDVLSNLRKLLGPFLNITRQAAGLDEAAGIFIDCQAFANTLLDRELANSPALTDADAALLRDVIDLYRGDFMAGFYLDEAPLFEEWMLGERERLRQLALQALTVLADHHVQQGNYAPAIEYTMRLLAMDAWREEAHRELMLLLALSGQRSAALAQYEKCRRILDEELGVEPAAETTALYEQIRDGNLSLPLGEQGRRSGISVSPPHPRTPAPPLLRPPAPVHNLPAQLTPFVGREIEVAEMIDRLKDPACRLLTLVGPGGVGKTRLALQTSHVLLSSGEAGRLCPHGIYFVSLTGTETAISAEENPLLPSLNALIHTIADTLKLSFSGRETPQEQLFNCLRQKRILLILDNFEYALTMTRFLIELLQQAPGLKLLATSRARLNVRGEQLVVLEGLAYPGKAEAAAGADWEEYEAVQLFLQQATMADPAFIPEASDRAAISRICQLVDGLPLGVELAAGWVRLISCQEIAREIEHNLSFLQSAMRDVPPRHQSLHAVFDYSWRMLTPAEKRMLRQLSVFRGGFSREAAVQVTGATLPVLAALIDNSLLRQAASADHALSPVRYELLEVLRQYAAEKLAEAPGGADEEQAVRDGHARFYLAFLQQRRAELQGGRQQEALAEIRLEIENIRAAWRWAVAQGQAPALDQALESLALFYYMRSWFQEGEEHFGQAATRLAELQSGDDSGRARLVWAKLLAWQGWFTFLLGRQAVARTLLAQSLDVLRPDGAAADLVFPLNWLAVVTYNLGEFEGAQQLCQEGLAVSRASGYRYGVAIAKNILSQIAYAQGQYLEARRSCQEALAIGREIGNRWSMAFSLTYLGEVAYALGDYREARLRFQEGLAIREAMGDARGIATCLNHLGDTATALESYAEAHRYYQASLAIFRQIGNQRSVAASLTRLGQVTLAQNDLDAGREYFQEALRTAYDVQAARPILDALVGIASLLLEAEPEQALTVATLVWQHPETSKESQEQAGDLLLQLTGQLPAEEAAHLDDKLADVVETFLYQEQLVPEQ